MLYPTWHPHAQTNAAIHTVKGLMRDLRGLPHSRTSSRSCWDMVKKARKDKDGKETGVEMLLQGNWGRMGADAADEVVGDHLVEHTG